MFSLIKKLFSGNEKGVENDDESSSLWPYFDREIKNSNEIKEGCYKVVLSHLEHKVNLNKTGNKLSADEKKTLGINARLSITHELVGILTEEGMKVNDPKLILTGMYYRATFRKSREENIKGYKKIGVKRFKLSSVADERDCAWCRRQDGKYKPIDTDINELIDRNCICDSHCRLIMQPDIKI